MYNFFIYNFYASRVEISKYTYPVNMSRSLFYRLKKRSAATVFFFIIFIFSYMGLLNPFISSGFKTTNQLHSRLLLSAFILNNFFIFFIKKVLKCLVHFCSFLPSETSIKINEFSPAHEFGHILQLTALGFIFVCLFIWY